jgi:hypothetical protein
MTAETALELRIMRFKRVAASSNPASAMAHDRLLAGKVVIKVARADLGLCPRCLPREDRCARSTFSQPPESAGASLRAFRSACNVPIRRCLPPVRSTCGWSIAGRRSPPSPLISRLTLQLEPISLLPEIALHRIPTTFSTASLSIRRTCECQIEYQ